MNNSGIIRLEDGQGYTRRYLSQCLDEKSMALAREVLEKLGSDILLEGTFDSDTWVMADGKQKHHFRFVLEESAFSRGAAGWSGCTREEYVTTVKTHTSLQLGTVVLATLSSAAREALSLAGLTMEELLESHPGTRTMSILNYLPHASYERNALFEDVEMSPILVTGGDVSQQRSLPSLKACLLFDHHMDEYWKAADAKKRLAAFPVWLWWKLTSVLPLRPTEFLLMQWDCISGEKGSYSFTVRRTRLKKGKGCVTYRLDGDYQKFTYPVPDYLAQEVLWYCDNAQPGTGDLLFGNGKTLSYASMRLLLQQFYEETNEMEPDMDPIRLGDTRHLAMINLIISGGDPSVCRSLAGHASVNQSSWYYSNIDAITASMAFLGAQAQDTMAVVKSPYRLLPAGAVCHEVPGGRCDAPQAREGDIRPCLDGLTENMRLGECAGCPHFYPYADKVKTLQMLSRSAQELDNVLLARMVAQFRKGEGYSSPLDQEWKELLKKHPRNLGAGRGSNGPDTQ